MKPMRTKSTRRLRARAAAMNTHDAEFDDYGPEPNMKLSHAFLVVLLLHVIAVGGLYAFNSMKAGKAPKLTAACTGNSAGSGEQPATPQENSSGQDRQTGTPEGPGKKPSTGKAPVVAKTSEAPKAAQSSTKSAMQAAPKEAQQPVAEKAVSAERSPVGGTHSKNSLFAGLRTALQRLAGVGAGGAAVATAAGQDAVSAQPADATAPAVESPGVVGAAKTYVVKAGDTITKIAASLGVTIPDLEQVNGLTGNAVLRVGQSLKVPEKMVAQVASTVADQTQQAAQGVQQLPGSLAAAAAAATGTAATAPNASVSSGDMAEYTVAKGDNPYKIAKKFKITPDELMKTNNITDPKKIQIGQKLKIPPSHRKTASPSPAAR